MVFTINGIGDSAATTTDKMADWLARDQFTVTRLRYPLTTWRTSRNRLKQYQDAAGMLEAVDSIRAPNKDLVAHSHGCLLAARIMELGGSDIFRRVILFAPALDSDWIFPRRAFAQLYVVHNPKDRAIWMAHKFPAWHEWGKMGCEGFRAVSPPGPDHRIRNVRDPQPCSLWKRNHGHYFREGLPIWGPWAARLLKTGCVATPRLPQD